MNDDVSLYPCGSMDRCKSRSENLLSRPPTFFWKWNVQRMTNFMKWFYCFLKQWTTSYGDNIFDEHCWNNIQCKVDDFYLTYFIWKIHYQLNAFCTLHLRSAQGSPNFFGRGPHWWFLKTRQAKRTKEFNLPKIWCMTKRLFIPKLLYEQR